MQNTQVNRLLEAFKKGVQLSTYHSALNLGIATFSQRINNIERMGYRVDRAWITPPSGNRYMVYWIVAEQFNKVA